MMMDMDGDAKQGSEFWPPERLGPYRVLQLLGVGGTGVVYKARDERLQRDVAIKFWGAQEIDARDNLLREARMLARINHPGVVQVFDVYDGITFAAVVMEYIPGVELTRYLAQVVTPSEARLKLATSIAQGLAAAHHQGVIHRDLAPRNVLVTVEGDAKLTDFGIASLADEQGQPETVVWGSLHCMSPEQLRGEELDLRSDLFSLGCLIHWLISGQFPAEEFDDPAEVLLHLERRETLDSAMSFWSVSDSLLALVEQLLAPDPARRPQSAEEVVGRLEQINWRKDGAGVECFGGGASNSVETDPVTIGFNPPVLPKKRVWAQVTVIAVLVSTAVMLVLRPPDKPPTDDNGIKKVAIVIPTLQNPEHVADVRLMRSAVHKAVMDGLPRASGVEFLTIERLPLRGGAPSELLSALQADELVSSHMDCTSAFCNVSLRRYAKEDLVELADVQVPLDSYGVMHRRLVGAVPRLYQTDPTH